MTGVRALWAKTKLHVWPERYVLASLPREETVAAVPASGFFAIVAERDETSILIAEEAWAQSPLRARTRATSGPMRVVTLDLDVDLATSGYLAPAAERFAHAGVSIVPVCAYRKDHLAIAEPDLGTCVRVLDALIAECRERP